MVCEWRIEEVLAGQALGPLVRAAHWSLRDGLGQPIAGAEPRLRAKHF